VVKKCFPKKCFFKRVNLCAATARRAEMCEGLGGGGEASWLPPEHDADAARHYLEKDRGGSGGGGGLGGGKASLAGRLMGRVVCSFD
jgi:hypothetical protein